MKIQTKLKTLMLKNSFLSMLTRCLYKASSLILHIADFLAFKRGEAFLNCDASARVNKKGIRLKAHTHLSVGADSIIDGRIFFERENASFHAGQRTFIGASLFSCAENIWIGDDVLIAFGVVVTDHNSHAIDFIHRKDDVQLWYQGEKDWTNVRTAPVYIGDKVWIGMNALILKGLTIGEGAVIGAGSVVTKDVPPWTLVAGNPARIIRRLCPHP